MDREGGFSGSCYYSILGIRKDSSFSDIRSAYRQLALKWHPDRWTKNPTIAGEAKRRFQTIQEAYSVLSDKGRRSMYDAGVLDILDDDQELGNFLHDLMNMMDKNVSTESQEESLEDLQRTFVEMFGADLAKCRDDNDPTAKRKAREDTTNAAGVSNRKVRSFRC